MNAARLTFLMSNLHWQLWFNYCIPSHERRALIEASPTFSHPTLMPVIHAVLFRFQRELSGRM